MISRVIRTLLYLLVACCVGVLGYRGYQLWQKHQRQKKLFVYFQKDSPVTKRLPSDALLYLNLYDFKRIFSDLKGTTFYEVMTHWLDTGMSGKEKPNALLGGMLEQTILNVLGEEFGAVVVPAKENKFAFVAIARIPAGSDFILNLALSSAKNSQKMDSENGTLYAFETKDPSYPHIYIAVQSEFAFASNDLTRLRKSAEAEASGPQFVQELDPEPISEETFLIIWTKRGSAIAHGKGNVYELEARETPSVEATPPDFQDHPNAILEIQTNGTRLFEQPAASYSLQTIMGLPATGLLLQFANASAARNLQESILAPMRQDPLTNPAEQFSNNGIPCHRYLEHGRQKTVCSKANSVLLTEGQFGLEAAVFESSNAQKESPLTIKIDWKPEKLDDYRRRLANKDWSRFAEAKAFYFLSTLQSISGGIDGTQNKIIIEMRRPPE